MIKIEKIITRRTKYSLFSKKVFQNNYEGHLIKRQLENGEFSNIQRKERSEEYGFSRWSLKTAFKNRKELELQWISLIKSQE